MDRAQKEQHVASLRRVFEETAIVVVTHYSGLNVAQMNRLRNQMREAGARFKVTKNRLTRLAIEGTRYQGLGDIFVGPTAIAYSDDPTAAAKAAVNFAKGNDKLVVLGGFFGEQRLDADGVRALAALPSLDELRTRIACLVNTPATRIAGILKVPAGQVARVLGAYAERGEAA